LVSFKADFVVLENGSIREKLFRLICSKIDIICPKSQIDALGSEISVGDFHFFDEPDNIDLILSCLNEIVCLITRKVFSEDEIPWDFDFVEILISCNDGVLLKEKFFCISDFL
jgi:hypothetical protein